MIRLALLVQLLTNTAAYEHKLTTDIVDVLKSGKQCTQAGYNKIYKNLSIISILDENLDRYTAVQALRKRCPGMKSEWERELYE